MLDLNGCDPHQVNRFPRMWTFCTVAVSQVAIVIVRTSPTKAPCQCSMEFKTFDDSGREISKSEAFLSQSCPMQIPIPPGPIAEEFVVSQQVSFSLQSDWSASTEDMDTPDHLPDSSSCAVGEAVDTVGDAVDAAVG